MKLLFSLLFLALLAAPSVADIDRMVRFSGSIGPYEIELELSPVAEREENLSGRYRYVGKSEWLDLTGHFYANQVVRLVESWNGTETGRFFLAVDKGVLAGHWVNDKSEFSAELDPVSGWLPGLYEKPDEEEISSVLSGTYRASFYYINSWFAPAYEVGFEGGDLVVEELDDGRIAFWFDFVSGPTYHIASRRGEALMIAPSVFAHDAPTGGAGDEESCHLTFTFTDRAVSVKQISHNFACEFGMRAHANFDLEKINDETPRPPRY